MRKQAQTSHWYFWLPHGLSRKTAWQVTGFSLAHDVCCLKVTLGRCVEGLLKLFTVLCEAVGPHQRSRDPVEGASWDHFLDRSDIHE